MHDTALELYNELLETYFDEYHYLSHGKRKKMDPKCKPKKLFAKGYDYREWSKNEGETADNEESTDNEESINEKELIDLCNMPPLEGDEKVKIRTRLKNLTPNKSLTRLPILLAEIKARNNSYKLKNEIKKILYLLYQHNEITRNVYNNLIKSL